MIDERFTRYFVEGQCINLTDPTELHHWGKSLCATREEITNAVAEVGPFIDKVLEHLSRS